MLVRNFILDNSDLRIRQLHQLREHLIFSFTLAIERWNMNWFFSRSLSQSKNHEPFQQKDFQDSNLASFCKFRGICYTWCYLQHLSIWTSFQSFNNHAGSDKDCSTLHKLKNQLTQDKRIKLRGWLIFLLLCWLEQYTFLYWIYYLSYLCPTIGILRVFDQDEGDKRKQHYYPHLVLILKLSIKQKYKPKGSIFHS